MFPTSINRDVGKLRLEDLLREAEYQRRVRRFTGTRRPEREDRGGA